jgi:hypothetical protein
VVGAFFAASKDKDRQKERDRRLALVQAWLASGGPPTPELLEMQQQIRARLPVFHWMTEFPEVFYAERADPLEKEGLAQRRGDAGEGADLEGLAQRRGDAVRWTPITRPIIPIRKVGVGAGRRGRGGSGGSGRLITC